MSSTFYDIKAVSAFVGLCQLYNLGRNPMKIQ